MIVNPRCSVSSREYLGCLNAWTPDDVVLRPLVLHFGLSSHHPRRMMRSGAEAATRATILASTIEAIRV